jgi:tRNA modification GTPase
MTFDVADTIAAIASAPGGAVRGIVRLTGPLTMAVIAEVFRPFDADLQPAVEQASLQRGLVQLPRGLGELTATLYFWPTPKSYTHQPSAELHLPGCPPLLEAALEAVCRAGARLARPGEFTLRAFLAGRLDLTQAEAVLGVIDAHAQHELEVALAQLAGGLARPLAALREELLEVLAHLEAGLDFVEEDIEFISPKDLQRQLASAARSIAELAARMHSRGQSGFVRRVVLLGRPNVGKSSLLNALAGEGAALVSDLAGTTRDFVTRRVNLGGSECLITDTAGILPDPFPDELEAAAQSLAARQAADADLRLLCVDASQPLTEWDRAALAQTDRQQLIVITKCDLASSAASGVAVDAVCTSSVTGQGLTELRQAICAALDASSTEAGVVASTGERCRDSLRQASAALAQAQAAATAHSGDEIVAAEIRIALDELGRVAGAVYTDDILDRVFSRFCIGK